MAAFSPVLPGLRAPASCTSAAQRRGWLLQADVAELAQQLRAMLTALQPAGPQGHADLATFVGAPLAEVVATPFGLRAVCVAANAGSALVHHELRVRPDWPATWQADEDVADAQDGVWDAGVLHAGKYAAFLQDEPFAGFNPGHLAKWTPHELCHRAGAFFWRDDATAWEWYLGARLNELVPVSLWYGLDQALRGDSEPFEAATAARTPGVTLADCQWWDTTPSDAALQVAAARLQDAARHFTREWDAITLERAGARPVAVSHPELRASLDASSDAMAYVVGHARRLPAMARLMGSVLTPGVHYDTTIEAYATRTEALFDALVFGALQFEPALAAPRRDARRVWDWLQRTATLGEMHLRTILRRHADVQQALAGAWSGAPLDLATWQGHVQGALRAGDQAIVFADGWRGGAPTEAVLQQVNDGFASLSAHLPGWLQDQTDAVSRAALDDTLWTRAPFAARWTAALQRPGVAILSPAQWERWQFDVLVTTSMRRDDAIERLAVPSDALPDDPTTWFDAWVVPHPGAQVFAAQFDILAFDGNQEDDEDTDVDSEADAVDLQDVGPAPWPVAVVRRFEDVSVVPMPAPVHEAFTSLPATGMRLGAWLQLLDDAMAGMPLDDDLPGDAWEWVIELATAGVVGVVPAAR